MSKVVTTSAEKRQITRGVSVLAALKGVRGNEMMSRSLSRQCGPLAMLTGMFVTLVDKLRDSPLLGTGTHSPSPYTPSLPPTFTRAILAVQFDRIKFRLRKRLFAETANRIYASPSWWWCDAALLPVPVTREGAERVYGFTWDKFHRAFSASIRSHMRALMTSRHTFIIAGWNAVSQQSRRTRWP